MVQLRNGCRAGLSTMGVRVTGAGTAITGNKSEEAIDGCAVDCRRHVRREQVRERNGRTEKFYGHRAPMQSHGSLEYDLTLNALGHDQHQFIRRISGAIVQSQRFLKWAKIQSGIRPQLSLIIPRFHAPRSSPSKLYTHLRCTAPITKTCYTSRQFVHPY